MSRRSMAIGSYNWNTLENKDEFHFKRKLDAGLGMPEA